MIRYCNFRSLPTSATGNKEMRKLSRLFSPFPAGHYMFNVNNRNTRTSCEICSDLIIKTQEQRHWCCSGVFIVNFEHISHFALLFLLLTLSR